MSKDRGKKIIALSGTGEPLLRSGTVLFMCMMAALFTGCNKTAGKASPKPDAVTGPSLRWVPDQYVVAGNPRTTGNIVNHITPAVVGIGIMESNPGGVRFTNLGSGVIIDPRGNVLLCASIINENIMNGFHDFKITLFETGHSHQLEGRVLAVDPGANLALIRILPPEPFAFPYISLDNFSYVRTGDWLLAVGTSDGIGLRATPGIAGSLNHSIKIDGASFKNLFQTDMKLKTGGLGCPVFDMRGKLTGFYINNGLALPVDQSSPLAASRW
jgi:S1-C subfamily serine protease